MISYKLRFRTSGSTDVLVDPVQLLANPGIDTGRVTLGTAEAPGDDSNERVETSGLLGDQRAATVSLAAVLARRRGADHHLADVPPPVVRVGPRALTVAPGLHVHLLELAGLAAPGVQGPPAAHGGRHRVVVLAGGGQAGGDHGGREVHRVGEPHDGEVVVGCPLVVARVGDPLTGRYDLLPVRPGDVVLPQDHPEVVHVRLAVGRGEDRVGAEESSTTEGLGGAGPDKPNLPGKLILTSSRPAHYLGAGGGLHPTPAVPGDGRRPGGWSGRGRRTRTGRGGQAGTGECCACQQDGEG